MAAATRRKKKLDFPTMQFVAVITVAVLLFLLFGFTHRAALNYRVHQRKLALETHYAQLLQENTQLVQKYQEVQSNAYVEEVARRELRWTRPGEKLVVVVGEPHSNGLIIAPPETASIPAVVQPETPPETTTAPEPLDLWLELFFPSQP